MGRGRRRKRSLGGGCGGWIEGEKGREEKGYIHVWGYFFTTDWEEFAALGVHTSSPSLPHG